MSITFNNIDSCTSDISTCTSIFCVRTFMTSGSIVLMTETITADTTPLVQRDAYRPQQEISRKILDRAQDSKNRNNREQIGTGWGRGGGGGGEVHTYIHIYSEDKQTNFQSIGFSIYVSTLFLSYPHSLIHGILTFFPKRRILLQVFIHPLFKGKKTHRIRKRKKLKIVLLNFKKAFIFSKLILPWKFCHKTSLGSTGSEIRRI